jgi:hypothetical protein
MPAAWALPRPRVAREGGLLELRRIANDPAKHDVRWRACAARRELVVRQLHVG